MAVQERESWREQPWILGVLFFLIAIGLGVKVFLIED